MNDLTILHLSDLHINSGANYSNLLKRLLKDIKEQFENTSIEKIVVVVTGDIINKGDKEAICNAKHFFADLNKIIAEKVVACYIVPGNHDKKRTGLNELLIPAYRSYFENKLSYTATSTEYKEKVFEKSWIKNLSNGPIQSDTLWDIQKRTYEESGYFDLIEYICNDIFGELSETNKQVIRDTFGADVISVNDKRYCFVLFNTAWSCIDDHDIRHLILGDFQINHIVHQYQHITADNPAQVVIALGHHPINCLYGTEQDYLFNKMISINDMKVNTYLCGHTHDRNIINWSNTSHTMYTLMTGIGWPDQSPDIPQNHYYSLYTYNLDVNSLDIVVRSTRTEVDYFNPDLSLYLKNNIQADKVSRPLFYKEYPGAIPITMIHKQSNKTSYETLFATSSIIKAGPPFLKAIRRMDNEVRAMLNDYCYDLCENLKQEKNGIAEYNLTTDNLYKMFEEYIQSLFQGDEDVKMPDEIKTILKHPINKNLVFINFDSFIQQLCQMMRQELTSDFDEGIVRFHFKYLSDRNAYIFSELCASFSENDERNNEDLDTGGVKYGELLEYAFNCQDRKCLIYSVNKHLCQKPISDIWSNFITIIPIFEKNRYTRKMNNTSIKRMPKLTFEASISDSKYDWLLFCLDYYRMDEILGEIIETYLKAFDIELDDYFTNIKKDKKEV